MSMENNAPPSDKRPGKRTRNFAILLLILILAAGGCLAWYLLYARYYESTDDAYVNGNQVTLTPQITGTVTQVTVDEGDYVEKGQPWFCWTQAIPPSPCSRLKPISPAQCVRCVASTAPPTTTVHK